MPLLKLANDFKKELRNYLKEDEMTPAQKALLAGGAASAAYSIPKSLTEKFYDELERRTPPMTMEDVLAKIKPGDVIMSRVPRELSPAMNIGQVLPNAPEQLRNAKVPLHMNEIIQLILGTPYTHASMKMQHGNDILNVMMNDQGAKMENLAEALRNQEFKIYRPFAYGKNKNKFQSAMNRMGRLVGKPYRSTQDTILTGLKHIFSPLGTPTNPDMTCKGQTCMSAIANAYHDIIPTEESVATGLRQNPNFEFVGRYNPGSITPSNYERFATRVASPILNSLKYALPVGLAAYAYNKYKE